MRWPMLACLMALATAPATALSHGLNGHIHVTAWAIDSLPEGELKTFFADPELRNAALFGAIFPDTAFIVDDHYGELAHWEPFVEAYIEYMRSNEAPFTESSSRKKVAFILGVAAHGLQDEIFDTLFLPLVTKYDEAGQDQADPGTDAFFHMDGYTRESPHIDYPATLLVDLYESAFDHQVSEMVLNQGIMLTYGYISARDGVARAFDTRLRPEMPWTVAHYDDPHVPGSLSSEVPATRAYLQALWARLHGDWDGANPVIHVYPAPEQPLLDFQAGTVETWTTLVFGSGVRFGSVRPEGFTLRDSTDTIVPTAIHSTRWGGSADDLGRVVALAPTEDLAPDQRYTATLERGVEQADGQATTGSWSREVRTPCDSADATCEPREPGVWVPPSPPADMATEGENLGPTGGENLGPSGGEATDMSHDELGAGQSAHHEPAPTKTGGESSCRIQRTGQPWGVLVMICLILGCRRYIRSKP